MEEVLHYAAEASEILALLIAIPGACTAARKRIREHRRRKYQPRHAGPVRSALPVGQLASAEDAAGLRGRRSSKAGSAETGQVRP